MTKFDSIYDMKHYILVSITLWFELLSSELIYDNLFSFICEYILYINTAIESI